MKKKPLRQQLRERLAALSPTEVQDRSAAVCRLLCEHRVYRNADVIMVFLSLPREVDTAPLALQAWNDLKRVLAPHVSWEQRRLLPIEIHSLTTHVQPGLMGLREPVEGTPVPVSDIDLAIVPGLAFDEQGHRLGRGRGFYDRFLKHRDFRGVSCALAFEEQVVDSVPVAATDVRVNMVVTDVRVRQFPR